MAQLQEDLTMAGGWTVQLLSDTTHGYEGWETFAVRDRHNVCRAVVGEVDRHGSEHNRELAHLIAAALEMRAALYEIKSGRHGLAKCRRFAREALQAGLVPA